MDLHAYRFGAFLLDPAKRILARDGALLTLQPKAFDVIVYLVEQRDRAVGRDELIAAVWGKADISDNALGQVVLQARRAVDDSGGDQQFIRTVPRFGYRWIAPVERLENLPAADPPAVTAITPSPPSASPHAKPRASRTWIVVVALLIACAVAFVALTQRAPPPIEQAPHAPEPREARSAPAASALVVLPFAVDAPPSWSWVRLGAMDYTVQRLRNSGQPVVPSDEVVGLAQRHLDARGVLDTAALLRTIGASDAIVPQARLRDGRWSVRLELRQRALAAEGVADDPIGATREAVDRLARMLGLPAAGLADAPDGLAALLQQVRAAILSEQLDEARALLLGAGPHEQAQPAVRLHLAELDFRAGRLDEAERALRALQVDTASGDAASLHARVLNTLANIAYQRHDIAAVEDLSQQALRWLADRDDKAETGRALIGRATAHSAEHRYDEALADYAQARVVLEAAGDRLALARVDAYLGLLEVNRDRHAEAVPLLADAAARLQAFDAVVEELHARVGLVMAQLALLEPAAALAECERLEALAARVSDPRRRNYADLACADAEVANGHLAAASTLLRGVDARAQPAEATLLQQSRVQRHRIAADLAFERGEARAAARELDAALALPDDFDSDGTHARLLLLALRARLALGDADGAARTLAAARAWGERHADDDVRMQVELAIAAQALADADADEADRAFEAALAAADASRIPANLLAAAVAASPRLVETGRLDRAAIVVGRGAPWSSRHYDAALLQLRLYRALGQPAPWQAALDQASALAGERVIPPALRVPPSPPPPL
ncbi:MAG TPA: winged helix-turn-helix domain-containing protein [Dokdonella sp.]